MYIGVTGRMLMVRQLEYRRCFVSIMDNCRTQLFMFKTYVNNELNDRRNSSNLD